MSAPTSSRRRLTLASAVLLALLALAAALAVPLRDSAPPSAANDAAPAATAEPVRQDDEDGADGEEDGQREEALAQLPIETYEIYLARDPFRPLQPTGAVDGDGNGNGTDGDGTDGDGTDGDGVNGDGTDGAVNGDGDACRGNGEVVCDGRVVDLVDVFTDDDGTVKAVVRVDETMFTVTEGDTFAENFEVLAIEPPCVTLLFGDDSFTLCEGEQVLK